MLNSTNDTQGLKLRQALLSLCAVCLLCGCASLGDRSQDVMALQASASSTAWLATPVFSPLPSENNIVLTPSLAGQTTRTPDIATRTLTPSPTDSITPNLIDQTKTPALLGTTPTGTPPLGDDQIYISMPGDLSIVRSPILLIARLYADDASRLRVELRGQDGRLLFRQVISLIEIPIVREMISIKINFKLPRSAEPGRLYMRLEDPAGIPLAVNSVNLVLLTEGEMQLRLASSQPVILIQKPEPGSSIHGGKLMVGGVTRLYQPQRPLRVQLITLDGMVIGQRLTSTSPASANGVYPFTAEVPYQVSGRQVAAYLVVFDKDPQTSQITYLSSLEIMLSP